MDTTRRPHGSHHPGFTAENRAHSIATPSQVSSEPGAPVTVDRSDGVARPSIDQLNYEADSTGHRVVARYADGRVAFAFGSFGSRPGQFNAPLDVVAIQPAFSGEPVVADGADRSLLSPWLAVADYGNHRVQFFECDGAWVGETELEPGEPPCQLAWRSPALEVTTLEGRVMRVHVAAALLSSTRRDEHREPRLHSDPRRVWRVC